MDIIIHVYIWGAQNYFSIPSAVTKFSSFLLAEKLEVFFLSRSVIK